CFICQKHRGEIELPGGAIYEDALVFIGHGFNPDTQADHYLGHVLIEPKRHVPGLDGLTDEEARQIGLLTTRLGRALKEVTQAEHIYLFVMGHHVDHLHLHLFPRYPGTPREYWGTRVDEWPNAPKGDAQAIQDVCMKIRHYLEKTV
ncbi:MAG: HIT domain-containing protein, partial [Chloroflexi bacterium]|nr:HIT domain-containing protein [Chloroflexota bacterium]